MVGMDLVLAIDRSLWRQSGDGPISGCDSCIRIRLSFHLLSTSLPEFATSHLYSFPYLGPIQFGLLDLEQGPDETILAKYQHLVGPAYSKLNMQGILDSHKRRSKQNGLSYLFYIHGHHEEIPIRSPAYFLKVQVIHAITVKDGNLAWEPWADPAIEPNSSILPTLYASGSIELDAL